MKTMSNAVLKKAQESHNKQCPCGTTNINEMGPWVNDALKDAAEQQYFTWVQSRNSRPRTMGKLREFLTRNFFRR